MFPQPRPVSHIAQIILIGIGLGIVGLIVVWGLEHASPTAPQTAPSAMTAPAAEQWPSTKVDEKSLSEHTPHYDISATYPVVVSMTINTAIKSFIDDSVATFKNEQNDIDIPSSATVQVYTLAITYTEEQGTHADNYIFKTATDTGGAHGMTTTKTFTYAKNGTPINVDALFTNGHEGLVAISAAVQKDLLARESAQASFITEGAAPTEDNYANFTVSDDAVTFIFDPYQVAPYAAGTQQVTIPLSLFKGYANPEVFGL